MSRVFLSHSGSDTLQAVALEQWLVEQEPSLEGEIFLDVNRATGILTGQRWRDALRSAAERCEAVVCLVSPNWLSSHECEAEYRVAEYLGKRVFCARLEAPTGIDLTREWQRCDLYGHGPTVTVQTDRHATPVEFALDGLERLLDGLRAAGIGAECFRWPPDDHRGRAPYRGWDPFEPIDAAVYFGRDTQIVRAMDELRAMRSAGTRSLFAIVGPSGTGKSSFLRAGLIPRLRRDDRHFVVLDIVRPGRDAITGIHGLAAAIHGSRTRLGLHSPTLGAVKSTLTAKDVQALWHMLAEVRNAAWRQLTDDAADVPTLVLPIDQAEELVGSSAGWEANLLLGLLGEMLRSPIDERLSLIVTYTIRTDRYELVQSAPELAGVEARVFDDLKPMPRDRFRDVITGPARRATQVGHHLEFAPALVDQLLEDCADGADALPLLALTLAALYRDYGAHGLLTPEHYLALGGMSDIVTSEVDHLLAVDPTIRVPELELLRSAFIPYLATIDPETDEPVRRIARWDELPSAARPMLERFVDRRLLIKDDRGSGTVVEVTLESLLRQWEELAGWLHEQGDDLRTAAALERAAAEWNRHDRETDWLLTGTRLVDAETLAGRDGFRQRLAPTRRYLDASRLRENARVAAEKARQEAELRTARRHATDLRRRARILVALVVVAVLAAATAVVLYSRAETARRHATMLADDNLAARLVAEAQQQFTTRALPGGERRAIVDMIAAYRLSPKTAGAALIAAQYQTRYIAKVFGTGTTGTDGSGIVVTTSPDGHWVATGALLGPAQIWDTRSGTHRVMPIMPTGDPAFDRICLMSESDKRLMEKVTGGPALCPQLVRAITMTPDGRWVATGAANGVVQVWDTTSGAVHRLNGANDIPITRMAISSDGRRLVTGDLADTIRTWDTTSGKAQSMPFAATAIGGLAVSADGRIAAVVTDAGAVVLWDTATGAVRPLPGSGDRPAWSVAVGADGRWVAAGGLDGSIRLWDTTTDIVRPMSVSSGHSIHALAITPDGRWIAGGEVDGVVQIWDTVADTVRALPGCGKDSVETIGISADGHRVSAGADAGAVRLWDIGSTDVRTMPNPAALPIGNVIAGQDGHWVAASVDPGPIVQVWDTTSGAIRTMPGTVDAISSALAANGSRLAAGAADGAVRLWNITGDAVTAMPKPHPHPASATALSPNGRWVAAGYADGVVRIWDTTSDATREIHESGSPVDAMVISADGHRVAARHRDSTMYTWDTISGKIRRIPTAKDQFSQVAISPDSRWVAVGGNNGAVRLWDSTADTVRAMPNPGNHPVSAVAVTADGHWVVAGDDSGTVYFWSTDERQTAAMPVAQYSGSIGDLKFNAQSIVVTTNRGAIAEIPLPTADPNPLCSKLATKVQKSEWDRWVSPDIAPIPLCDGR